MKLFIASDIHGSAYYAELLLKRFEESDCERMLLLGDLLYHGPRNDLPRDYNPKKVIEMLNGIVDKLICVRGNCEAEVDQMVLNFPVLADYSIICDGDFVFAATHGHHLELVKNSAVVLYGHTHVPADYEKDGTRFINPGSVSIPKENSAHSCIIYSDGEFAWYDIESGKEYFINK